MEVGAAVEAALIMTQAGMRMEDHIGGLSTEVLSVLNKTLQTPEDTDGKIAQKEVIRRVRYVQTGFEMFARHTQSQGDNVKALCELNLDHQTMWYYVCIACTIAEGLAQKRASGDHTALVMGITAPAGGGKSTIVQALKTLLVEVIECGRVEELSLDDFLSSQAERAKHGILSRWDINSTNEDFADVVVRELKNSTATSATNVPCFTKGLDERDDRIRTIHGKVDVVLFEGWRVGVDHPNFFPFNDLIDQLMYINVDFDAILNHKYECVVRDIAKLKGKNMYEKYGGYQHVFDVHYRGNYINYIEPVRHWADIVIEKNASHHITSLTQVAGRWQAKRDRMAIKEVDTVVVGAGQAGLCSAYWLQKQGMSYAVLEKSNTCGSTWLQKRWDSFHLVTENSLCRMPDFPTTRINEPLEGFMSKFKIAEYLQAFCDQNKIQVEFNTAVTKVTRGWAGTWVVQTAGGVAYKASSVIMACGGFHRPRFPSWSRRLPSWINQIHSSYYKNPEQLNAGSVLVVGAAQSGTQIATELAESGRRVFLSVGATAMRVPRKVRGKDFMWWMARMGLFDTKISDLPAHERERKRFGPNPSSAPFRDVRFRELCQKHDLTLVGKTQGIKNNGVSVELEGHKLPGNMARIEAHAEHMKLVVERFIQTHPNDGDLQNLEPLELEPVVPIPESEANPRGTLDLAHENITTIVWCTGYHIDLDRLVDLPNLYDDKGYPHQTRGHADGYPGLFFLGLHWMHKWKSAIFLGCAEDSEHVVSEAAKRRRFKPDDQRRVYKLEKRMSRLTLSTGTEEVPDDTGSHEQVQKQRMLETKVGLSRTVTVGSRMSLMRKNLRGRFIKLVGGSDSSMGSTQGDCTIQRPQGQLSTHDAAQGQWQSHYDLLPNSSAVVIRSVGDGQPLQYVQLRQLCEQIQLHRYGIGQGDRLCAVLPNGPQAACAFLALSLFCTYAPLNMRLTSREFEFEFEDLPAKAVVVMHGEDNRVVLDCASKMNVPVLEMLKDDTTVGLFSLRWMEGARQLDPLVGGSRWPKREDIALVLHTSGTTKKPKIVPLSHLNITSGARCISSTLQLAPSDVCINIMPLFHIHGIAVNVLTTALSGASVVCTPGLLDAESFFEWLNQDPCPSWYSAVPTMHQMILQYAEAHEQKYSARIVHKLRMARNCSAALLPAVASRMEKTLGIDVLTTYAMTESMPISSNQRDGSRKLKSVGLSGGPQIIVLRDPPRDVTPCKPGVEGHVCVRGECVTKGYEYRAHMGKDDPNQEAFTKDGWLCTGDKGFIDEDGHLTLSGRYKEIISRGAEKISPFEVEDVLLSHPAVQDLICFACPHVELGEVVGAAFQPRAGMHVTLQQLKTFGKKNGLSQKWLPEVAVQMTSIPKGPTGKPARINLAKRLDLPRLTGTKDDIKCWDVVDVPSALANDTKLEATPLEDYLKAERDAFGVSVGPSSSNEATTSQPALLGLTQEGWNKTIRNYLWPAIQLEVAKLANESIAEVAMEEPLHYLGLQSQELKELQRVVQETNGMLIPIKELMDSSASDLVDRIVAGGSGGLGMLAAPVRKPSVTHDLKEQDFDFPAAKGDTVPLLPMQKIYWAGRSRLMSENPQPAWISWEAEIENLDQARFEWALNTLISRHEALRTMVGPKEEQRVLSPRSPFQLQIRLAAGGSRIGEPGPQKALDQMRHDMFSQQLAQSYPLIKVEGIRMTESKFRLLFIVDLLIADAHALSIFTEELYALYKNGEQHRLPQIGIGVEQYIKLRELSKESAVNQAQIDLEQAFWNERCLASPEDGGLPQRPQLPMNKDADVSGEISRLSGGLSAAQWQQLRKKAKNEGITPTTALFAAYCSVINAWSSTSRFAMTLAAFNRDDSLHPEAKVLMGNFGNIIVVGCDFQTPNSFKEIAKTLQGEVYDAVDHSQYTAGVDVMSALNRRDDTPGRAVAPYVFASVLAATEGVHHANPFTWYGSTPKRSGLSTPQVFLDVQVFNDRNGALHFNWDAHLDMFPAGLVTSMFDTFSLFLATLAADDDAWARRPILVPKEQLAVRNELHSAEHKPELEQGLSLLHAPVVEQAYICPDKVAVLDPSNDVSLSFKQLSNLAHKYAHQIVACRRRAGVGAGTKSSLGEHAPVAILMHKGWEQVVAALAALLSGAAYLPVSLDQPVGRILAILEDAGCVCALTAAHSCTKTHILHKRNPLEDLISVTWPGSLQLLTVNLERQDADVDTGEELPVVGNMYEIAYMIYTSGSTGKPKGVMTPHIGAANTCWDINERWGVTRADVVLSLAALSFDLSVFDIFGVVAAGGALVMPDRSQLTNPMSWLELMETHGVTVWNTAPPVMTMLLECVQNSSTARERFRKLPLRLIMLSGDWIPVSMPKMLLELIKNVDIYSLGGATEASIWSCWYKIDAVDPDWRSIPYGRALGNQKMWVLDQDDLSEVPNQVVGEICIGGIGLAAGYYKDEKKTAGSFTFSKHVNERVYRTGDLGRYMPSGDIEFLGRADFQVKVNGNRIEIGEVEAGMKTEAEVVKDAMVVPYGQKSQLQLVGFVLCSEQDAEPPADGGHPPAIKAALAGLDSNVPSYMHPAKIHCLTVWPMSANGKIDRKQLLETHKLLMDTEGDETGRVIQKIEPRNQVEEGLMKVWEDVLSTAEGSFGVMDSFTDVGGTSILQIRMGYQIEERFGREIGFKALLEHQTVASLAAYIGANNSAPEHSHQCAIIPQNSSGSGIPFFCVAPVSGNVFCYSALCKALGNDQPVFCLQHPGVEGDDTGPIQSVEELAEDLCKALLSQLDALSGGQDRSAFSLGGWSMGGVIALEMAMQLRSQHGLDVQGLVLIDSPAPTGDIDISSLEDVAGMMRAFALDVTAHQSDSDIPTLTQLAESDDPAVTVLEALKRSGRLQELRETDFKRMFDVYSTNQRALAAYNPAGQDGKRKDLQDVLAKGLTVHLLRATTTNTHHRAMYPSGADVDFGWTRLGFSPSNVLVYLYQGDHYGILDPPVLQEMLHTLAPMLALGVGGRPSATHSMFRMVPPKLSVTEGSLLTRSTSSLKRVKATRSGRSPFKMASGASNAIDAGQAAVDAYSQLLRSLDGWHPSLVVISAAPDISPEELNAAIGRVAPRDCLVHAVSSVAGAVHNSGHDRIGLLGFFDPKGTYSVGWANGASGPNTARQAGKQAAEQALVRGQTSAPSFPDIVVVTATTGAEEEVLAGIADVIGPDVPIIGGSAADAGSLDGSWWVMGQRIARGGGADDQETFSSSDGVVVTFMWPSVKSSMVFSSCYAPTAARGVVTAVKRREVIEINHRPAAQVYSEWVDGNPEGQELKRLLDRAQQSEPGSDRTGLLADTTLTPLAKQLVGSKASNTDETFFQLMHPSSVGEDGGIQMFAEVEEGQEIVCMRSTRSDLVDLVTEATSDPAVAQFCDSLRGALAVYCGGCSLAILDKLPDVGRALGESLRNKPFITMLTYGEQGTDHNGRNRHGNLMYSLLLFGGDKAV